MEGPGEGHLVGEWFVHCAKDLDLNIGDLQQLGKCSESICKRIPRRLRDHSLQLGKPVKADEFTRKRRVLSHGQNQSMSWGQAIQGRSERG
jgi:hypothetical protein